MAIGNCPIISHLLFVCASAYWVNCTTYIRCKPECCHVALIADCSVPPEGSCSFSAGTARPLLLLFTSWFVQGDPQYRQWEPNVEIKMAQIVLQKKVQSGLNWLVWIIKSYAGDMGCIHSRHPNKRLWEEEKQKEGSPRFQGWSYEEDESEAITVGLKQL